MTCISRSLVLFLVTSLLLHPFVDLVKKPRHRVNHLCRKDSIRRPGHEKRLFCPCPSGKYRSPGANPCRGCRNCTQIQRVFSKKCGQHYNAECGHCIDSYWDVTANSKGSDGGHHYPCQHCRFDDTNSRECSGYRHQLSQTTTEFITTEHAEHRSKKSYQTYEEFLPQRNEPENNKNKRIPHRLTSSEDSIRRPGHEKRLFCPCPSGKYRSPGADLCRGCRNCTQIQRVFSKNCGQHYNAECGHCIDSYWDVTANSKGSDGGRHYPCQHCRFDDTNSRECSGYRHQLSQTTTESITTTEHAEHRSKKSDQTYEEFLPLRNEPQNNNYTFANNALLGNLLVVLIIILIVCGLVYIASKSIQVFKKYTKKERRSYTDEIEDGYRPAPYAVRCSDTKELTKSTHDPSFTQPGYVFGDRKYSPVWTKNVGGQGITLKAPSGENDKSEVDFGLIKCINWASDDQTQISEDRRSLPDESKEDKKRLDISARQFRR